MLTVFPWLVSELLCVLKPPKPLLLIVISCSCQVSLQCVQDDTVDHSSWFPWSLIWYTLSALFLLPWQFPLSSLAPYFLATSLALILVLFSSPAPLSTIQPVFLKTAYMFMILNFVPPVPILSWRKRWRVESGLLSLSGWMRRGLGKLEVLRAPRVTQHSVLKPCPFC